MEMDRERDVCYDLIIKSSVFFDLKKSKFEFKKERDGINHKNISHLILLVGLPSQTLYLVIQSCNLNNLLSISILR